MRHHHNALLVLLHFLLWSGLRLHRRLRRLRKVSQGHEYWEYFFQLEEAEGAGGVNGAQEKISDRDPHPALPWMTKGYWSRVRHRLHILRRRLAKISLVFAIAFYQLPFVYRWACLVSFRL